MKKPQRLTTFFLHYTLRVFLTIVAALLLTWGIYALFYAVNIIVSVPYTQPNFDVIAADMTRLEKLTTYQLPNQSVYAVFGGDGELLYGDADATQRAFLWSRYEELGEHADAAGIAIRHGEEIRTVQFRAALYKEVFRYAWLQRLFPHPTVAMIPIGLLLFLGGLLLLARRHSRTLNQELAALTLATEKIQAQDLDFAMGESGIYEINEVLLSMGKMKAALSEALLAQWEMAQARRTQTAALVHDTQTPITIIKGNAELLMGTDSLALAKEYGGYIHKNAQLISDYMDALRRVESGEEPPAPLRPGCDAGALWQSLGGMLTALCAPKGMVAQVQKDTPKGMVQAGLPAVERAFSNILSNAVYYTHAGMPISLHAEAANGQLRLTLRDSGPGFSRDALLRAAELSYTEKAPGQGHGLGLYTAGRIMRENGGSLSFGNVAEGGAWVTLALPFVADAPAP